MADTFNPSERHAAFTAERLSEIATGLRDVRDDALNSYEPLKEESVWTLGCSKYERSKFKIKELVRDNPTWMSMITERAVLRCTFAIDGIPVRYFHSIPEFDPPAEIHGPNRG